MIPDARTSRTTKASRRPRGVSFSVVDEAKAKVAVLDLADRYCGAGALKRVGQNWVANCPLPDHRDRSPSFTVNPQKNLWMCFGCNRGGDVIELHRFMTGAEKSDVRHVAAEILDMFGFPLPGRPQAWFRKQDRQKDVRELARATRTEVLARRLWRVVFAPILAELEDPKERMAAARKLWPKLLEHSRLILETRDEEKRQKGASS
jgi:CHC2 zinc finger